MQLHLDKESKLETHTRRSGGQDPFFVQIPTYLISCKICHHISTAMEQTRLAIQLTSRNIFLILNPPLSLALFCCRPSARQTKNTLKFSEQLHTIRMRNKKYCGIFTAVITIAVAIAIASRLLKSRATSLPAYSYRRAAIE